jgi:hypothetical protein
MKRRLAVILVLLIGSVLSVLVTFRPTGAAGDVPMFLGVGDSKFWDGEYVKSAQVPDPQLCGKVGFRCFEYKLVLGEGGARLRVGIDAVLQGFRSFADPPLVVPPGARFRVQLKDSEEHVKAESCLHGGDCPSDGGSAGYSTELFWPNPAAGEWTVLVIPTDVADLSFRMRAKLETESAPPEHEVQLPNLRMIPPYEPTLIAPAYPFGPAGISGVSCMPEEMALPPVGEGAIRCLRFSSGVENNGDGAFALDFEYGKFCADTGNIAVYQRLRYADYAVNSPDDPDFVDCNSTNASKDCNDDLEVHRTSAGCATFHPTHGHFHYEGIYRYTLFKVTNLVEGTLALTTTVGHKRGFDPSDEEMADWNRFYHELRNEACCSGSGSGSFVLGTGWGDIYDWNRSGQYVDFPQTNADGFYVIRGEVDVADYVLETDDGDNTGYALVVAQGETVGLCERGYGEGPWDPNKVVQAPSSDTSSDALATQISPLCAPALKPDLRVTNLVASNNDAAQGEKVTITATITNPGLAPAAASKTEFLLDNTTVLGLVDTPAIAAGGTTIVSLNWDTRSVRGEHTIRVTADKTGLVAESSEINNAATLPITVRGNKVASTSTAAPTACASVFSDVPPNDTFYQYVQCLACRGIISGYPCGSRGEPCNPNRDPYFRPTGDITRGQIAKIVSETVSFTDPPGAHIYEDVPEASPFYLWINRLSRRGVMGGYPCGGPDEPCGQDNRPYFRPGASATRGQMSKIVASAAGSDDPVSGQSFEDLPPDEAPSSYYQYVQRLYILGAVSGYPCGRADEPCGDERRPYFRPHGLVTRGQASKIVSNTFFPNC